MGKAIIVRDGIRTDEKINAQTLQSAYQNGVLSDATSINTSDPFHANNQPHLVDTTSSHIPSDLSWGIREVYFKAVGTAVISITGVSKDGTATVWFSSVTTNGTTTTIGEWKSVKTPLPFVGSTSSANGEAGMVPAPTTADVDTVLRSDGSWGLVRRTMPIASITKNNDTGVITIVYTDGTSETLTKTDDTHYTVVEKDSSGNTVRTYVTTIDAAGNVSVAITEGSN